MPEERKSGTKTSEYVLISTHVGSDVGGDLGGHQVHPPSHPTSFSLSATCPPHAHATSDGELTTFQENLFRFQRAASVVHSSILLQIYGAHPRCWADRAQQERPVPALADGAHSYAGETEDRQ